MKQKKQKISRVLILVLLLTFAGALQFSLLRQAGAQDRTINVNERLNLRALGIENEIQRLSSLGGAHARLFKRSSDLQQKSVVSPRDASGFFDEADARKSDLLTIKRELESLINKVKQGNLGDATFDAQVLASLKSANARSAATQGGGASKVFREAIAEVDLLRQDIDDEVRQVNRKQTGARNRSDRVFAAHARSPVGKGGCNILLSLFLVVDLIPGSAAAADACAIVERYNKKGCSPKLACN